MTGRSTSTGSTTSRAAGGRSAGDAARGRDLGRAGPRLADRGPRDRRSTGSAFDDAAALGRRRRDGRLRDHRRRARRGRGLRLPGAGRGPPRLRPAGLGRCGGPGRSRCRARGPRRRRSAARPRRPAAASRLLGVGAADSAAGGAVPERRRRVRPGHQGALAALVAVGARRTAAGRGVPVRPARPRRRTTRDLEAAARAAGGDRRALRAGPRVVRQPGEDARRRAGRQRCRWSGGPARSGRWPHRARRRQLAENAKLPAIVGALPEAHHNQVVSFDGPLAGGSGRRRPVPRPRRGARSRCGCGWCWSATTTTTRSPRARARRLRGRRERPRRTGVASSARRARAPVERLASLVGLLDYASVYLGLAYGIDPTPIAPDRRAQARAAARHVPSSADR